MIDVVAINKAVTFFIFLSLAPYFNRQNRTRPLRGTYFQWEDLLFQSKRSCAPLDGTQLLHRIGIIAYLARISRSDPLPPQLMEQSGDAVNKKFVDRCIFDACPGQAP